MRLLTALLSISLAVPVAARAQDDLVTAGATGGSQRFADGHVEQGFGAVVRLHLPLQMSIAATPAWARVTTPASLGGGSVSGAVDLPLELTIDHQLPGKMSPTIGGGLSMTLPVGDTASGFGSGAVGYGVNLGLGLAPASNLYLHAGAGRPLSDFSTQGALGGSGETWGDLEADYQLTPLFGATLGFDGDLTSSDTVVGASRALVAGASYSVGRLGAIVADVTHGVSGSAARWGFSVGFGTDFAHLESLGSRSVVQRAMAALGGQSRRGGWGQGASSTAPGRGRKP